MHSTLLSFLIIAAMGLTQPKDVPVNGEGKFVIENGTLIVNGKRLKKEWMLSDFEETIGKPERVASGLSVYDSQGVMLWPGTNNSVAEFKIVFNPDPDNSEDWFTKGYHTSAVVIDGISVNGSTTRDELLKALPQYNLTSNGIGSYDGAYNGIYFFAKHNADGTKLLWLAIGFDDEDYD